MKDFKKFSMYEDHETTASDSTGSNMKNTEGTLKEYASFEFQQWKNDHPEGFKIVEQAMQAYADQQVKAERNKVIDECIRVFDCNEYYYGDIVQSMLKSFKIKQP